MKEYLDQIREFFKKNSVFTNIMAVNIAVFFIIQILQIVGALMSLESWFVNGVLPLKTENPTSLKLTHYWLCSHCDWSLLVRRPWSVITYMFTHESFIHLASNMAMFFFFGKYLFQFLGGRKLLSTYLLGGIAGLVIYVLGYNFLPALKEFPQLPILGASASVLACVIAAATYAPRKLIRLFSFNLEFRYLAAILVVIDILALDNGSNTGGHLAHLGGALFGFIMIKQLQKGRDINRWFENALDWVFNLFKRNPRMKVVHNAHKAPPRSKAAKQTDEEYNYDRAQAQQKIDRILDKIAAGGYSSLTKSEKEFLNKYSAK